MINVRLASATSYVHNTIKCTACPICFAHAENFDFVPLIYFCFDNVCARVESAAMLKLSSRHHKYGGRSATVQVRNLTETNSRQTATP